MSGAGLPRGCLPGGIHPPCGQTDTCENITFPQLLLRTVNITYWKMFRSFSILKNIACHNCVNLTTNGNVPRGKSIHIITKRHFIRMPTARLCGVFVVNVCREGGTCVVRSKMNKFELVWGGKGPCMEGGTDTRALYRVVWGGGWLSLVLREGARALYMTPFSNRMTDTTENITFPQFLWRAIKCCV